MAFAHGFGPGFGFGLGFLNFIGTLLFFVVLFWFVSNFFRRWRYPGAFGWGGRARGYRHHRGGEADGAVATARERFSRGEISAEEFAEIKRGLGADAKGADSPLRNGSGLGILIVSFISTAILSFCTSFVIRGDFLWLWHLLIDSENSMLLWCLVINFWHIIWHIMRRRNESLGARHFSFAASSRNCL